MSRPASTPIIIIKALFIYQLLSLTSLAFCQRTNDFLASESFQDEVRGSQGVRIMSYNVENLFDYFDDSLTQDDEFLPYTGRFWTKEKYQKKTQQIAQVIMAAGGWEAPAIVGLCEVENRYVLETLTRFSPLKKVGYEIVHKDSPDRRGIDVALIYRPDKYKLLYYDFFKIHFPLDSQARTRDILYAKGLLANEDTLHLFMNHWPSKYGGEFETEDRRIHVANQLKLKMDSIRLMNEKALILAMGDLNDTPSAKSLKILIADGFYQDLLSPVMYQFGTHSFANEWSIIDHFIASSTLTNATSRTKINPGSIKIFDLPFLLTDGSLGNQRPFRTYQGPAYKGGFSDHLPIILDLVFR